MSTAGEPSGEDAFLQLGPGEVVEILKSALKREESLDVAAIMKSSIRRLEEKR